MEKGKIIEIGTHLSLLRDYPNGTYAKLVRQQEAVEEEEGSELQNNNISGSEINSEDFNEKPLLKTDEIAKVKEISIVGTENGN